MLDIINKREYFEWLNKSLADHKNVSLKGIQDGWILSILSGRQELKVAEIGGGKSRVLQVLSKENECWNIDKLEGAGNGPTDVPDIPGVKLVRAYMGENDTSIPDNHFDVVFSISVVEHVPNVALEAFFSDCCRILKPGGIMLHAIDLYISDERTQRVHVIDIYRKVIDAQDFEWLSPPTVDGQATFRCSYASNSDVTLNRWNRVAPALKSVREVSQSVSLKMFAFKKMSTGEAEVNSFLSDAEIRNLRQPSSNATLATPQTKSNISSSSRQIPRQTTPANVPKASSQDTSQNRQVSQSRFIAVRKVLAYYSRWPVVIAILAIVLNTLAFTAEEPYQWFFATGGTTLLLLLVGHAASKASYVAVELEQVKTENQQAIVALRRRVKRLANKRQQKAHGQQKRNSWG
ncbi:class I SAM-dependent methyltransferase [Vacuolonema iberomarrocanum]|uniref:class I SAM-dependent methyltransferase n=1 Tax=Vacuolonema iberomarrocanum TaxID=3454632 RepID=UPI0019E38DD3|nr:class I SAM-dependent methyltransferase [filamentous cyanobacterium LEGE 07170]